MLSPLNQKLENLEQTVKEITSHVAAGGSATDLAKAWGVNYGTLMYYLRKDPSASQALELAFEDRNEWVKEEILNELKAICNADPRKVFDKLGDVLPPNEWPDEVAKFIKAFTVTVDQEGNTTYKFQMWDKLKAIDMVGKHLGLFVDRVHHSGTLTLEDVISESRRLGDAAKEG
jgi:hypothetical protein